MLPADHVRSLTAGRRNLVDDVVGAQVSIDGTVMIGDRFSLVDFGTALGIWLLGRAADAVEALIGQIT